MPIVRNHYQKISSGGTAEKQPQLEATIENTEGWKTFSVCSSDLGIIEISGDAVITCTHESRV